MKSEQVQRRSAQGEAATEGTGEPPERRRGVIGPFTLRHLVAFNTVIALVAVALFVVTRPFDEGSPGASFQPGASFYRISAETEGLEIGQKAPDFVGTSDGETIRLTDLDGGELRIGDFAGKPLWIVFWATWCPPCQQETPDIRATYEAHRADGLVVLAIDIQEPAEAVREYTRTYELTYPIGLDVSAAVMKTYGVFGLPTHYFVDRSGVIRDRYFGPLTRQLMEQRIRLISEP